MALEDDIAFFERVPALAMLGRQALRVLAIGAEARDLQSGAVLFRAGDVLDGGYVVQKGVLRVESGTAENKEYTVGPGTLLGEMALLTDTVSPVTTTATEPTVLIRISRSLFRKMLEGYPAAAARMRKTMITQLEARTHELASVRARLIEGNKQ